MACFWGHKWDGCTCEKCGKHREEGHVWHQIDNQCIERCNICGKQQKTKHVFELDAPQCLIKCKCCGHVQKEQHNFKDGACTMCGKRYLDPETLRLIGVVNADAKWENRRDAAGALAAYPCEETLETLLDKLKNDEHSVVRFFCAESLGKIGYSAAVMPLIDALQDKNNTVVSYAAKALGELNDSRAVESMLDVFRSFNGGDTSAISAVVEGLGMMGDTAAPRLLELVDSDIKVHVLEALAQTGAVEAKPILIKIAVSSQVKYTDIRHEVHN